MLVVVVVVVVAAHSSILIHGGGESCVQHSLLSYYIELIHKILIWVIVERSHAGQVPDDLQKLKQHYNYNNIVQDWEEI